MRRALPGKATMLVLSRKANETIRIGDNICIRVVSVEGGCVKLGIDAPLQVSVHRGEVYERIQEENRLAARRPTQGLSQFAKALQRTTPNNAQGGAT
jgi:carbon storage regulator